MMSFVVKYQLVVGLHISLSTEKEEGKTYPVRHFQHWKPDVNPSLRPLREYLNLADSGIPPDRQLLPA